MSTVMEHEAEDLEALFDKISAERSAGDGASGAAAAAADGTAAAAAAAGEGEPYDIFQRVGSLTRNLHDALRELGYDRDIDAAVGKLPDARARLTYIASLTGQAAEKTLSKAEAGTTLQGAVAGDARALAAKWDEVFAGKLGVEEFRAHAEATGAFLRTLAERADQTSALFTDIMLAQDFHDLTGQVINRIVAIAQTLEDQLVKLLLDATPPERRSDADGGWLNGPAIDTKRDDVVANQGQVDDLLASLGF
ncbi:MAG: protein phosphatase CheZ [Burkholderiales bacterium]|nr:protein phosphatase CheZ [Burkholderiales bacterium]